MKCTRDVVIISFLQFHFRQFLKLLWIYIIIRSFRSCAITAATDRSEDEQTNCLKEKTKIYIEQKKLQKIFLAA